MSKRTIVGMLAAVPLAAIVVVQATRVAEAVVVAPASTGHAFEGGITPFSEAVRALATVTIAVDFGNTSTITESCGTVVTATAATNLTAAQKTSIRNKIKEKYEAVLGAGNATVTEEAIAGGTGTGDYGVIISGGKGPGGEYGDAGAGSGKPAIVHVGFYKNKGFSGDGLINAIAETAAHEVAHRIGVSHNGDKSKLMASGTKVSKAQREADARPFSDDDKDKIKENLKKNTESKSSDSDKDLNSQCGHFPDMGGGDDFVPDDHIMGAVMWYEGWPGLEFGYAVRSRRGGCSRSATVSTCSRSTCSAWVNRFWPRRIPTIRRRFSWPNCSSTWMATCSWTTPSSWMRSLRGRIQGVS
ncbi:MAG: hypothetical protein ACYTAQ_16230 [Planctomycetota bacterium]|jgi:hypothetical protein